MRQPGNHTNARKENRPDNIKTWTVKNGGTILEVAASFLKDHTPTKLKSMLKHNQFAVNSMPMSQYDFEVHEGDTFSVNFDQSFQVFSNPRVKLVYEDEHILVINKGYGVLSMGTDTKKDGTAYSIMREYVKYHDPRAKVFIVHRLDRDTSGLMMLAKTIEAKEAMQHNWNNMVLNRKYIAVVEGEVKQQEGVVKSYLAENSQYEVYSTDDPSKGQFAVTRYKCLKATKSYSMMEVELDTGRKNQIRVHMKDLGHPIAGDRKYGAAHSPINRLALHAQTLRFVHPITRREMNFSAPIPSGFRSLVKGL
ncbi:MAG: RluA family pseudouridine synthase [Muribaculaceae bacterium]|nr:RluA family pseudouridine synthase [Muribaculaceae bacterium]MEE1297141.1 RluA family pseudouridine synthase [Muribaculaceae bacterium]